MALSLAEAEQSFLKLLDQVEPRYVADFLSWISDSFVVMDGDHKQKNGNAKGPIANSLEEECLWNASVAESDALLRRLAIEIRSEVPQDAVFSSETTFWPQSGLDSDCDPLTTVHVDSFLYDEDDLDDLVDNNRLSRNYCLKCGSKDVGPLTFISHSLSIDQLRYIFTVLVPLNEAMRSRLIVDVGSRLGAVLFAVYFFGVGRVNAVGIEMNKDLCDLQNRIIMKNGMESCLKVINDDVRKQTEMLAKADIIVMNNVFSFFLPQDAQVPTGHLAARFAGTNNELFEDCEKITLYSVKPKS